MKDTFDCGMHMLLRSVTKSTKETIQIQCDRSTSWEEQDKKNFNLLKANMNRVFNEPIFECMPKVFHTNGVTTNSSQGESIMLGH